MKPSFFNSYMNIHTYVTHAFVTVLFFCNCVNPFVCKLFRLIKSKRWERQTILQRILSTWVYWALRLPLIQAFPMAVVKRGAIKMCTLCDCVDGWWNKTVKLKVEGHFRYSQSLLPSLLNVFPLSTVYNKWGRESDSQIK